MPVHRLYLILVSLLAVGFTQSACAQVDGNASIMAGIDSNATQLSGLANIDSAPRRPMFESGRSVPAFASPGALARSHAQASFASRDLASQTTSFFKPFGAMDQGGLSSTPFRVFGNGYGLGTSRNYFGNLGQGYGTGYSRSYFGNEGQGYGIGYGPKQ